MTLYRAVSQEEFADHMASGVFRCPPGTLEIKWFAEQLEDAREWGRRFGESDGKIYKVVEVVIATDPPMEQKRTRMDGIGPACWLSLEHCKEAGYARLYRESDHSMEIEKGRRQADAAGAVVSYGCALRW